MRAARYCYKRPGDGAHLHTLIGIAANASRPASVGLTRPPSAHRSSFFIWAPGTPAFGEANPGIQNGWNLQDSTPGAPQGLEEIAQTSTGRIDAPYYDTGMGDPVTSNEGILDASSLGHSQVGRWFRVAPSITASFSPFPDIGADLAA
jgi:hypothetical protein